MYRIAIIRPGKPTERRTCATSDELRTAFHDLARSQGVQVTRDSELVAAVGDARRMADIRGFAALQLDGGAAVVIRPQDAKADGADRVRADWVDYVKYHGLSEVYIRPRLERAAEMWGADAGEWEASGWKAHRAYWASVGVSCGREGCAHH